MVMNPIFLLSDQETMSRDLPPTTTLAMTLFLSSCLAGFYIYDIMKRNKSTEARVAELEHVVHETATLQESQSDILQEHDNRIREKKDYDESEEIQEGKYQAWSGSFKGTAFSFSITIWREKYSTFSKNGSWVDWDGEKGDSCIVRDFYLGNSHPDFSWTIQDNLGVIFKGNVSETLINGWDSIIRIELDVVSTKENILEYVGSAQFEKSATMNLLLKALIEKGDIRWSRVLIDA
jgi:hypothetical protein